VRPRFTRLMEFEPPSSVDLRELLRRPSHRRQERIQRRWLPSIEVQALNNAFARHCSATADYCTRLRSCIQLVSHVLPPSGE
jgi:hypothetical protein